MLARWVLRATVLNRHSYALPAKVYHICVLSTVNTACEHAFLAKQGSAPHLSSRTTHIPQTRSELGNIARGPRGAVGNQRESNRT